MLNFFSNFQNTKLEISSPELINLLLLLSFVLISIVTIKKESKAFGNFMSYDQTEQLKGIAIFFVVLGHLWVHVSVAKPSVILSGNAVSMFLILSGFGITISNKSKKIGLRNFLIKRINRVMIPYWFATILIILLDYAILNKTLDIKQLILTILGLNLSVELRHLDYVRWFVTFIIFWYVVFFFGHNSLEGKNRILFILLTAFIILPLNYYFFHFGWYQFFSFPTGCIIGIYFEPLKNKWQKSRKTIIVISTMGLLTTLIYAVLMGHEHIYRTVYDFVPNIVMAYLNDAVCLISNIGVFGLFLSISDKGYQSRWLLFLGRYSYELFLLHGVFLIKYNPFIHESTTISIIVSFMIFFIFLVCVAFCLSRISQMAYAKSTS